MTTAISTVEAIELNKKSALQRYQIDIIKSVLNENRTDAILAQAWIDSFIDKEITENDEADLNDWRGRNFTQELAKIAEYRASNDIFTRKQWRARKINEWDMVSYLDYFGA